MDDRTAEPEKSDWYRHGDVDEIVFAVADGRVLTVREYPSFERFTAATKDAQHLGTHPEVADLPDPEVFQDDNE